VVVWITGTPKGWNRSDLEINVLGEGKKIIKETDCTKDRAGWGIGETS